MQEKLNCLLLIDDDHINNFIVTTKLNSISLVEEIHCVENGHEALSFIKDCITTNPSKIPSLIFLDINMPVMDGWEFLDEFQKFDESLISQMHIYMVSSSVYNEDIERSKKYPSVKMFISKPLVKEKIEEIIKQRMMIS